MSRSVAGALRTPSLLLWALYLIATPFYVFKSGLPQPGDLLVLLVVPVALYRWDGRLGRDAKAIVWALLRFTGWVILVNVAWAVATGRFGVLGPNSYLMFPVYYIYNALVFVGALVLYRRHGNAFLRVSLYAICITIGMLCVSSIIIGRPVTRGTLFFENPNQLGYYALLCACMILLVHWRLGIRSLTASVAIVACGYLALLSASRAAVAGTALLLVLLAFSSPRAMILASLLALSAVALGGPVFEAIEASHSRGRELSFFEERRYDRILTHAEYVPLGAGEGGLGRFATETAPKPIEIHSAPATILFSYGIIGVVLFGMFLWNLLRGAPLRLSLGLIPPLAYTIAHQGLRFTMLWVLLAVFVSLKSEPHALAWPTKQRKQPRGAHWVGPVSPASPARGT